VDDLLGDHLAGLFQAVHLRLVGGRLPLVGHARAVVDDHQMLGGAVVAAGQVEPATRSISRMRRIRSSNCSTIIFRFIFFCAFSRNSIAAQRIRLNRIRLIRWMTIGADTSRPPARAAHLRPKADEKNPDSDSNIAQDLGAFAGSPLPWRERG